MLRSEIPRTTKIHAVIPATPGDAKRAIVNWRGETPHTEHTHGTHEETLASIGLGNLDFPFLSVKRRMYDLEKNFDDDSRHIVYETKATAKDLDSLPFSLRVDTVRTKSQPLLVAAAKHLFASTKRAAVNSYYDATIYGNVMPRF